VTVTIVETSNVGVKVGMVGRGVMDGVGVSVGSDVCVAVGIEDGVAELEMTEEVWLESQARTHSQTKRNLLCQSRAFSLEFSTLNIQFSNLQSLVSIRPQRPFGLLDHRKLPLTNYYSLLPFVTIRIGVPKNPYSSRIWFSKYRKYVKCINFGSLTYIMNVGGSERTCVP